MKNFIVLTVFACLAVAVLKCEGLQKNSKTPRITGGTETLLGQYPSTVSIDSPNNLHCTGTIINPQHVLTAASCVTTSAGLLINQFWVTIIAGDLTLVPESIRRETRSVIRMFVHPNYSWVTQANDLAVLRVNAPFPEFHNSIEPAMRNARILQVNDLCFFAGWGAANDIQNAPLRLQQFSIILPIVQTLQCNAATAHNGRVQATMLCAGVLGASPNAVCNGNQGGGLFCGGHLSGVLSFGINCGAANNPAVFIDVRQYNDWINQQFTRNDIPQPGSVSTP